MITLSDTTFKIKAGSCGVCHKHSFQLEMLKPNSINTTLLTYHPTLHDENFITLSSCMKCQYQSYLSEDQIENKFWFSKNNPYATYCLTIRDVYMILNQYKNVDYELFSLCDLDTFIHNLIKYYSSHNIPHYEIMAIIGGCNMDHIIYYRLKVLDYWAKRCFEDSKYIDTVKECFVNILFQNTDEWYTCDSEINKDVAVFFKSAIDLFIGTFIAYNRPRSEIIKCIFKLRNKLASKVMEHQNIIKESHVFYYKSELIDAFDSCVLVYINEWLMNKVVMKSLEDIYPLLEYVIKN